MQNSHQYRPALVAGYEHIIKHGFLGTNAFLEIQHLLEPNKGGIRNLPGTRVRNDITGEVYYTPPEGEALIRDLLKNFEDYYNDKTDGVDPLIKAAICHYQFEAIHSFIDGNGRTGRILFVLQLALTNHLNAPILYISGFINKNRNEYYELLRGLPEKNNWKD